MRSSLLRSAAVLVFVLGMLGGCGQPPAAQVPVAVTPVADTAPAAPPLYKDATKTPAERAANLLSLMTLEEKVSMISGSDHDQGFNTTGVPRLGIPEFRCADGPCGVRCFGPACAFPAGICSAATWDPALIERMGVALGKEFKAKGRQIALGPCVNINRMPLSGRNWESFGEDPYLAARIAVGYIKGVQSQNIMAVVKHFAANNQETDRGEVDVKIDERALHEIYFPAFKAAVQEGGVWAVMNAYNKINGFWCSENRYILTEVLKGMWGFKGIVMSDWCSTHHTLEPLMAGLDLEMPKGDQTGPAKVLPLVKSGQIPESVIDDKVRRILLAAFSLGFFDNPPIRNDSVIDNPDHQALSREVAANGMVLLKNANNTLPIDADKVKCIAVIGPNSDVCRVLGGGSGSVEPRYSISPRDGIQKVVGDRAQVIYELGMPAAQDATPIPSAWFKPAASSAAGAAPASGLLGEYYGNLDFKGTPALVRYDADINFGWGDRPPDGRLGADNYSVRWTGKLVPPLGGGMYLCATSDDGMRVWLDGKLIIDNWGDHGDVMKKAFVQLQAGRAYALKVEYYEKAGGATCKLGWRSTKADDEVRQKAVAAAAKADVAIVCVGLSDKEEGEARDRENMELPEGQNELIAAVAKANKRTVVVLNNGGQVLINRWVNQVGAIIEAWFPGQEGGNALASILFGNVNPSGKLPVTFVPSWESTWIQGNFPGVNKAVNYAEGIFVGYRWFDQQKQQPVFPFGHGLSYTTFKYSNLVVTPAGDKVTVSFDLENTGSRAGAEVAQVYVGDEQASVPRPPRELKAFQKIMLAPQEKKTVTLTLDASAFAFFDPAKKDWTVEPGRFLIFVGSSSRDIRLQGVCDIGG